MRKPAILILGVLAVLLAALMGCQPKEVTSAKVYIQQDDWDKAIEQLEQAVKTYPNDAEAHYLLGKGYGMKGRFEEMNKEFDASLTIGPKFQNEIEFERNKYWVENFNKGVKAFNAQKHDEAIDAFTTAITVTPDKPESYRNRGVAYIRLDKTEQAISDLQKALELEPDHINTLTNLGLVQMQADKSEEAIATFEKILQLDPKNTDAISQLGILYDKTGQTEKAMQSYKDALAEDPENPDLLFNYARLLYQTKQYQKAIDTLLPLLDKNPEDFEANLTIADAYLQMADAKRKEANELETSEGELNAAKVMQLRKDAQALYKKGIPYLEKSAEIKPDLRSIWYNLGIAYINTGEKEKGEAAFKKADELEKANK